MQMHWWWELFLNYLNVCVWFSLVASCQVCWISILASQQSSSTKLLLLAWVFPTPVQEFDLSLVVSSLPHFPSTGMHLQSLSVGDFSTSKVGETQPHSESWGLWVRSQGRRDDKLHPLLPLSFIALVFYMTWSQCSPNGPGGDVSVASREGRKDTQLGPIDVWSSLWAILFSLPG